MGFWLYCKECDKPVKAFEQGPLLICRHDDSSADFDVFSTRTDDIELLNEWYQQQLSIWKDI